MRRIVLVVLIFGAIVTAVAVNLSGVAVPALAQSGGSDSPAAIASEKQVIDNVELMELLFDPYYVDLRNSLKKAPEGRKEWRRVYIAAYSLAEITNLLFTREGEEYMATPEWNALALESRTAIEEVGAAVRELDYELTKSRYIAFIETCNNCHTTFEIEEPTVVEPFIGSNPQENESSLI